MLEGRCPCILLHSFEGIRQCTYPTGKNRTWNFCMIVYRITNEFYKNDISETDPCSVPDGTQKGFGLLYTSQFISLSILESLVHLKKQYIPPTQFLLHIEIPDRNEITEISSQD